VLCFRRGDKSWLETFARTLLEAFYSTSSSDSESPERIAEAKQIDAVLDLVGNSTIMDSVDMLRPGRTRLSGGGG